MLNVLLKTEEKMKKSIEKLKEQLQTVMTGRANAGILENIRIDYYNKPTPINQMAILIVPDPRTIEIKPYDTTQLNSIEKAILAANIGFTPQNDGKIIRLKIPPLTEERRNEFVKMIKKMSEDEKVVLRNERRDAIEEIKKIEKSKEITKDERFKSETDLQKMIDNYIKKIDDITLLKEKEIMTV